MTKSIRCAFISVLIFVTFSLVSCSVNYPVNKSSNSSVSSTSSKPSNSNSLSSSSNKSSSSSSVLVDKSYYTAADVSDGIPQSKLFNKDNSVSFTFCGHIYTLPNCKLSEFKANGFLITSINNQNTNKQLKPETHTVIRIEKKGNFSILADITIANNSKKSLDPLECNVVGIEFRQAWIEDNGLYSLPLGIKLGDSIKKVRSSYSIPNEIHIGSAVDSGNYIYYVYDTHGGNLNETVNLYFNPETYVLTNFSIIPFDYTLE